MSTAIELRQLVADAKRVAADRTLTRKQRTARLDGMLRPWSRRVVHCAGGWGDGGCATQGGPMSDAAPPSRPPEGPPPGPPPQGPPPGGWQQQPPQQPQGDWSRVPAKKRKKWPFILGAIVLLLIIVAAVGGTKKKETPTSSKKAPVSAAPTTEAATTTRSTTTGTTTVPRTTVTTTGPSTTTAPVDTVAAHMTKDSGVQGIPEPDDATLQPGPEGGVMTTNVGSVKQITAFYRTWMGQHGWTFEPDSSITDPADKAKKHVGYETFLAYCMPGPPVVTVDILTGNDSGSDSGRPVSSSIVVTPDNTCP